MKNSYFERQKQLVEQIEASIKRGDLNSTVVEIQTDYENDNKICLTSVVFPSPEICEAIDNKIIKPLQKIEPRHYYYSPESFHLTIKNIKTISNPPLFTKDDIEKVKLLYGQIIPKNRSFSFHLQGLVAFPTSISLIGYSDERLQKIVLELDKGLKAVGVPDDKKYVSDTVFFGNISLCRFTRQPSEQFYNKINELKTIEIGWVPVDEISLITCNVVCNKNGRKILGSFRLKD